MFDAERGVLFRAWREGRGAAEGFAEDYAFLIQALLDLYEASFEIRWLQWAGLGSEERRYLLRLPLTKRLTLGGKRFLLVHGTPRDPLDEYLMKDPQLWAKRVHNVEADIVCVGHSHMQFNLAIEGVVVVNPGSVGQPRDGDPRAAYAVIDDDRIELKRVSYPVEETIARIEAAPLPDRAKQLMSHCLREGRLPDSGPAIEVPE